MAKRALGRGLGALIPSKVLAEIDADSQETAREIPLDRIVPNPFQPRQEMDGTALASLVESVRESGVLQPLIVRRHKDGYQIIAGERRFRAAKKAGLREVPVVVRAATDQQMLQLALIENLQRSDLNPMEEAAAYHQLMEEFRLSQEGVARQVGKDRSTVANMLRLLRLPDEVQRMLREAVLTMGHARALLGLESLEDQRNAARQIVRDGLSVRQAEQMINAQRPARPGARKAKARGGKSDPQLVAMEEELQRLWGTKVKIKAGSKGSGTLEISFFSADDLDRILELLKGDA